MRINPIRRPGLDQIAHDIIRNSQIEKMVITREFIVQLDDPIVPAAPHLRRGKRAKTNNIATEHTRTESDRKIRCFIRFCFLG